jgi:hypothetical protein
MTNQNVKHTVYGRAHRGQFASRTGLDAVASRGLLTWWDLMSDLDAGWLTWSDHLGDDTPDRRAA